MQDLVKQVDTKLSVPLGDFQREGVRKLAGAVVQHKPDSPERSQCLQLLFNHVHHPSAAVTAEACHCICNLVESGELEHKDAYRGLLGAASVKTLSSCAFRSVVAGVKHLLVAQAEAVDEGVSQYSMQSTSHPMSSLLATRSEEW